MPVYTRPEALAKLREFDGVISPEAYGRRAGAIRTWTGDAPRELPDEWFSDEEVFRASQPYAAIGEAAPSIPGQTIAVVLQVTGWLVLVFGLVGAIASFDQPEVALQLGITVVVSTVLLLALAAVLQLLGGILAQLRQNN
ncbi:MAG: hypothetical protein AAGI52_06420 [Bacteroidota bacterium]